MTSRRSLLRKGLVGGALLAVGGAVPLALRGPRPGPAPHRPLQVFSRDEHAIFAAVAARVVPGPGADGRWPTAAAVDCAGKADALMAQAHPEIAKELKQLLALFDNGLVALLTVGRPRPFTRATADEQEAQLRAWGASRLSLFRTGYQALVRLTHATYYSSPEVYPLLGYPGPPQVVLPGEAI